MLAQEHRQWPRPDAVGVVFPEQIATVVYVGENVAIDDAAAERRVRTAGRIDLFARDQRMPVVDEWAKRIVRTSKADRERVVLAPRGVSDPIFIADLRHLRRPEIGDVAPFGSPLGLKSFG